jgi:hypothetical protein
MVTGLPVITAIPRIDLPTGTLTPIAPAMLMPAGAGVAGGGVVGGAGGSERRGVIQ